MGADSRMIDWLRLICVLTEGYGQRRKRPSHESHECVFYIYICIGINCCCWAYQVEQKFEAMSNKTRIVCVSVTAASCLGWVSLRTAWDLQGLGCGGGCAWSAPCRGDMSPPAKSIVCRPSPYCSQCRGGIPGNPYSSDDVSHGSREVVVVPLSLLFLPVHEQKCLKPCPDLQSKMIH